MKRYYCTLFDKNYLARGLALHHSLEKHAGDYHLFILCMDDETLTTLPKLKNVTPISLKEFEDPKLLNIKPSHTIGEYCWTVTPSLMLYLLKNNPKIDLLSYLDADLFFYSSPEPIFEELGKDSIMIVPHRFVRWAKATEKTAGIYNVSMVTLRNNTSGKACATWWRERCLEWCYNRYENGQIGDQKYLEVFPKLFKGVHPLVHIGGGVASWNLPQYRVWKKGDVVMVNDVPLIFFHFQGLKPFDLGEKGPVRELIYKPYLDQLKKYTNQFSSGFSKARLLIWLSDLSSKPHLRYPRFLFDLIKFYLTNDGRFKLAHLRPMLLDWTSDTPVDAHYLYHPVWAARILSQTHPKKHVDISSILSFGTMLSAFLPVEFYDYRPPNINLPNMKVGRADLTRLHFDDESVSSLSCLHTLEHIGLGRYGDTIDPKGDLKAAKELIRVLKKGGDLLIVVPVGKPKLVFNSNRSYSYQQIIDMFSPLNLQEFSLITDPESGIVKNASKKNGCGCFWFKKI